jgi:hypothetical protein
MVTLHGLSFSLISAKQLIQWIGQDTPESAELSAVGSTVARQSALQKPGLRILKK